MPKQNQDKILNYSKEQMFNLVADIDSYDEFLPWCNKSTVISKNNIDDSNYEIIADLEIGYQSLSYTYSCLLYTSPSPRDGLLSRMPSSA